MNAWYFHSEPNIEARKCWSDYQIADIRMSEGFPTYSRTAKQGERGVNVISRIVSDQFGWLFRRNHQEHDFGVDGHFDIVQDDGTVTGQQIAVQIKYGASFFKERNKRGYIYRGELKHFNYLANYPVPVIIALCDPKSNECYWALFQIAETRRTGSGWRLTIPFGNKLKSSKAELEALVCPTVNALADIKEYWQTHELIASASTIMFVIDRSEVQSESIDRVKAFFEDNCKSKELANHCQGKIELSFHGYDNDERELFEIDEIRKFVHLLDLAVPSLFFFLGAGPGTSLQVIAFCLTKVTWAGKRATAQMPQQVFVEFDGLRDFLERQFNGLNKMIAWLGMTKQENLRITRATVSSFGIDADVIWRN